MPIPINLYGDCTSDSLGSALGRCPIESFGDVMGINLYTKGQRWLVNDEFTQEVYTQSIQDLNNFPYNGIYDFTQDTPENERATSSTGRMSVLRAGKPQFSFLYDKGACNHKTLYDKRGQDKWDISFSFEKGVLMAKYGAGNNESIGGFDMGMFDVETLRLQQGTDPEASTAVIQLVNALQFNTEWVFLTWEQLGFSFLEIDGVINVDVLLVEAPEVGGSTLTVKAVSMCNNSISIAGLDDGALWLLGGTQTPTALSIQTVTYNATDETYEITVDGTFSDGDTVQPQLGDAGGNVIADETGVLYKGRLSRSYEVTSTT